MEDIATWRKRIDEIDENLVALLNERAVCAMEIGNIKNKHGIEIFNPERERFILDHIRSLNSGPLCVDAMQRIFQVIIEECRKSEEC